MGFFSTLTTTTVNLQTEIEKFKSEEDASVCAMPGLQTIFTFSSQTNWLCHHTVEQPPGVLETLTLALEVCCVLDLWSMSYRILKKGALGKCFLGKSGSTSGGSDSVQARDIKFLFMPSKLCAKVEL